MNNFLFLILNNRFVDLNINRYEFEYNFDFYQRSIRSLLIIEMIETLIIHLIVLIQIMHSIGMHRFFFTFIEYIEYDPDEPKNECNNSISQIDGIFSVFRLSINYHRYLTLSSLANRKAFNWFIVESILKIE